MSFSLHYGSGRAMLFWFAMSAVLLPVDADATSYFSGTVRDSHGKPIAGALIQAGTAASFAFVVAGQATTDQLGDYAITSLDTSNESSFELMATAQGRVSVIYPNLYCTDPSCLMALFQMSPIQPASGVDFTLPLGASISGHVTESDTKAPVATVSVHGQTSTAGDVGSPSATCDATGAYALSNLPPGDYTLQTFATTGFVAQAYAGHDLDDTLNPADDVVTLHEGQVVSNVDFALDRGATLSGLLTSALNGAPVTAQVALSRIGANAVPGFVSVAVGTGQYQSELLAPGSFHVQFSRSDDYIPLFYPHAGSDAGAEPVSLAAGELRNGIDAQLTPTRSIAGRVSDASSGQPLQSVAVHAGSYGGFIPVLQAFSDAQTDASGNYLLQGVDTGSYYVWIDNAPGYVDAFYPNTGPCCDAPPTSAISLQIGDADNETGINFALQVGARASGRVYDADTGFVASGVQVSLFGSAGEAWPSTPTDVTGTYTSVAVPVGSYYLAALGAIPPDLSFYYPNDVCSYPNCPLGNAATVQLSSTQTYQNLDLAIPHLDLVFRNGFDQ